MTDRSVHLSIARLEGVQLSRLVVDFGELVGVARDTSDPAIGRLTPNAYPEDAEASLAFADSTRDDILDRRAADAATVRSALDGFDVAVEALTEEQALAHREVIIPDADIDAWLRTLTALRLVIASRLEITDDDQYDPEDPRYDVYAWLGYRLEGLIQAADDRD
ncbi:DUF2017 family protein [Microbacterium sp. LWO13-1.2]|uniref:DUF2017 family protein n=1 Tax=Microbacterium sp. LWO13-1.2 TaxID=3135262 RepID=UPI003139851E